MTKTTGRIAAITGLIFVSFLLNGCDKKIDSKSENQKGKKEIFLDVNQSTIKWTAYKKTGKNTGTIKFLKGKFSMESGVPVSGTCSVDLNSIKIIDITDTVENKKVIDFIKSKNFLNTEKYPEAIINIRSIIPLRYQNKPDVNTTVKGNITIKDSTAAMVVTAYTKYSMDSVVTNSRFSLNSSQWKIPFNIINTDKDFKENPIMNEFDVEVLIVAK